ncbi:hypothetical protein J3Q64DRAFT_1862786 [Phycomyces blakesleeanus]|uniref:Uncharacterized protein n=2 Tax=Phycomyces blakesleeanus TaxID=4837 RepID=A0A162UAR3_PHYB8|nr:hypothetical protein PHYBLDRAFT_168139 [Phycomyces blakesleeanus NRRL 1555(-)]OAD73703.1 hypothetical protein PHYBLDRAFT_168139 [Phycomyces blakesleeanus NRRL 1555(-)]|eukprot:XP_018291743.1 hypothetical protein PHYBLDRAFT_168139 [Phycomyces blakesleeanus NRRL 1555(-)]
MKYKLPRLTQSHAILWSHITLANHKLCCELRLIGIPILALSILPYNRSNTDQLICKGDPVWPTNSTINENISRQRVVALFRSLRDIINARVTLNTLSEAPGRFTPLLTRLFSSIESEQNSHREYDVRRLPLQKRSIAKRLQRSTSTFKILKFHELRIQTKHTSRIESIVPNGENKQLFGNLVRSDGFSVDFLFSKRRSNQKEMATKVNQIDLKLDGFGRREVEESYLPIAVDPGRKTVFCAVADLDLDVRRCTTKEYYHRPSSTRYSSELNKLKKEKHQHHRKCDSYQ